MKKFLITVLIFCFAMPLFAQQTYPVRVIDNAGLLSDTQVSSFDARAQEIANSYNMDLVIVTVKDIGGKDPEAYADDFFNDNGYGLGDDGDGCLLLLVTEERDYVFSTSGRAMKLLDKNNIAFNKLESRVVSNLRNNDYEGAFLTFFNIWEEFLVLESKGRSYNFIHEWNLVLIIAAWVFSLLIAVMVTVGWKRQMITALPKREADDFIVPGSLAFTEKKDSYLYNTISKTMRESSVASSLGSGRGGLRTSSSGRTHGGRSGKY